MIYLWVQNPEIEKENGKPFVIAANGAFFVDIQCKFSNNLFYLISSMW